MKFGRTKVAPKGASASTGIKPAATAMPTPATYPVPLERWPMVSFRLGSDQIERLILAVREQVKVRPAENAHPV